MAGQRQIWKAGVALLAAVLLAAASCPRLAWADATTTITALASAGQQSDGQEVVFAGEAVGDLVIAEDGRLWVTLTDGQASISVNMEAAAARSIPNLGRHQQQGSRLEVTGTFHLACEDHEGLSDVHASRIAVLEDGGAVEYDVNGRLMAVALVLALIGGLLTAVYWLLRERSL